MNNQRNDTMTRICCNVLTCKHRKIEKQYIEGKNGFCKATFVILQPCELNCDNIVACSGFEESTEAAAHTTRKGERSGGMSMKISPKNFFVSQ